MCPVVLRGDDMKLLLLVAIMFMVSGCSASTWNQMHQAGMKAMAANVATQANGLSSALREAGTQKMVSAFTYTGNHHAEYLRNKRTMVVVVFCNNNTYSRYEYNSCLVYNGVR